MTEVSNTDANTSVDVTDLSVGDSGHDLVIDGIDRMDFVKYAGASGDFNPIHTVEPFATDAGNPSVFGHGMLTASFVSSYVAEWFDIENVSRLRTRFQSRLWPGDTVTVTGEITEKSVENGTITYEVNVTAKNQDDETLITGDATITL